MMRTFACKTFVVGALLLMFACLTQPEDESATVSVVVTDEAGNGIAGARVESAFYGEIAETGSSGEFSLKLDEAEGNGGPDTLSVAADGYFSALVLLPDTVRTLAIALAEVECAENPLAPNPNDPSDPRFTILSPNGGEVFYFGDTMTIRITAVATVSASVNVYQNFERIPIGRSSKNINAGDTISVTVAVEPDMFVESDDSWILVNKYNGNAADQSDCAFAIRTRPQL